MFDVSIKLLCSKKPGTLSRLIRDIKHFGLQYSGHDIDYNGEECLITVNGSGILNCSKEDLIDVLDDLTEVKEVQNLTISKDGNEVTTFRTRYSEDFIHASEPLTHTVLLTAEKRLAEILGPVASYLVETASTNNHNNAGELFEALAFELTDVEERKKFLSIIDNR
jgi:hypothetical protein